MDVKGLEKIIGKPPRTRPDGFGITVKEYTKLYGCGEKMARDMLESGIEKGLSKETMIIGTTGGKVIVYYLPSENT